MDASTSVFAVALLLSVSILFSGCSAPSDSNVLSHGNVVDRVGTVTPSPILTPSSAAGTQAGQGESLDTSTVQFAEWKAPDGSITLQVPAGWTASEKQIDKCTVNWAVQDPAGTTSAYMTNQILVFKSESARTIYKQYGLTGVDSVPVSPYLNVSQAVPQIVAPISGAADVQVFYNDVEATQQFSQSACFPGLAACDAQVFEAGYDRKGIQMRGTYMVQTFDLGDGNTWWINVLGFTSPASIWNQSEGTLEKIFLSAKYTDAWAANCTDGTSQPSDVVSQVITDRQAASDNAAQAWDDYILGK